MGLKYWQRFTSHWIDHVWLAILFTNILVSFAVVVNFFYRSLQVSVLYLILSQYVKIREMNKDPSETYLLISWAFYSIHTHSPSCWTTWTECCADSRYLSQAFVFLWYYCSYQLPHIQFCFLQCYVLMFCLRQKRNVALEQKMVINMTVYYTSYRLLQLRNNGRRHSLKSFPPDTWLQKCKENNI